MGYGILLTVFDVASNREDVERNVVQYTEGDHGHYYWGL